MIYCEYRLNKSCFHPKKCKKGTLASQCINCIESPAWHEEERLLKQGFMLD